ncbi:MAG: NAD-dependent epimerase/dehydratase family protein [Fimbriimonadaceae bacterium]|nr:NAD-dependent epimerase/dehydratase family protein [Fimbriimonadaceae bacterium]
MAQRWQGRRVLVTGAGGFVGGQLCAALLREGATVTALLLDQRPQLALDLLGAGSRVNRVAGNLCDEGLLERVLQSYEVDTVFHLAAQALVGVAAKGPVPTLEANIRGTWLLLEACRLVGIERVVVASSDKAYGPQRVLPYTEDASLAGSGPYDASKVCTDVLTRMYATAFGLPAAVTRCANLYGPGDLHASRLVPELCRAVLAGRRPQIRSDGSPTRDYLYIDDAVEAYLLLGAAADRPEVRGRAFNFGTGREVSVLELVQTMITVAGADLEPEVLGAARGEIDRQVLDSSLARATLGWAPQVALADGLRQTLDWTRWLLGQTDGAA